MKLDSLNLLIYDLGIISSENEDLLQMERLEKKEHRRNLIRENNDEFGNGISNEDYEDDTEADYSTERIEIEIQMNNPEELKYNISQLLFAYLDMDLKNNHSPLKQEIKLSLFDECSKLEISYLDQRFDDNYNTKPNETISISFHMDYLGFFGYEQKSNLLFEETGEVNYGN